MDSAQKPKFYKLYQVFPNGKEVLLINKPIFCYKSKAIELAIRNCIFEENLSFIKIIALNESSQRYLFEEISEEELKEYNFSV